MTAKEIRAKAFAVLRPNLRSFILIELLHVFISVAATFTLTLYGLGTLFNYLIISPLVLGIYKVALKAARGEKIKVDMLSEGLSPYGTCVLMRLVDELFVYLWSLLFLVPGIIRAFAYSLDIFVLADNPNMTQSEAREESIHLMDGNKWRLARLYLNFIGWLLLSVLTCGLLLLFVLPYMYVSLACFYEQVKAEKAPPVYVPLESEEG